MRDYTQGLVSYTKVDRYENDMDGVPNHVPKQRKSGQGP